MESLLSILIGLGLSAACGFRIFVPVLVVSIAASSGHLTLAPGFQWMGTTPAVIAFAVATLVEVVGYYVPWLDHMLDALATPSSVIAGIIMTASVVTDFSPFLKWSLAIIAGGGIAGTVQLATVAARGFSLGTTGGLANPVVSSLELGGSLASSMIALVAPWMVLLLGAILVVVLIRRHRAPVPDQRTVI
jgi:hypothetical protein